MKRRVGFPAPAFCLFAAVALLTLGCQRASQPRLVILYATCSLNRMFLEPYDPTVRYTPALKDLAREGTVFERHQTESGQSGIAFASIFTGLQAPGHGVYRQPTVISEEKLLIGEIFAESGWDTHAFLFHWLASSGLQYGQGVPPEHSHWARLEGNDERFSEILRSLQSDSRRRAFVVTNFTDTHAPYGTDRVEEFCELHPDECKNLSGPEEAKRIARTLQTRIGDLIWGFESTVEELGYDEAETQQLIEVAEIFYKSNVWGLDQRISRLIAAIREAGLLEHTLIAFTADHGEILHRKTADLFFTHGFQLAPEVLNVPLILYGPSAGVRPGRYAPVTRSIDLAWTIAGLAGVPVPAHQGDGRDLSRSIRGEESPPELVAYSHTALMKDVVWEQVKRWPIARRLHPTQGPESMWVGARRGDLFFQLRRSLDGNWNTAALDLSAGPGGADQFDPADDLHREVAADLAAYKADLVGDSTRAFEAELPIPEDRNRALLRHLGYIE